MWKWGGVHVGKTGSSWTCRPFYTVTPSSLPRSTCSWDTTGWAGAQGPAGRWEVQSLQTLPRFTLFSHLYSGNRPHIESFPPKQMGSPHHPAVDTRIQPLSQWRWRHFLTPPPAPPRGGHPWCAQPRASSIFHTLSLYSYRKCPEASTAGSAHGQSVAGPTSRLWVPSGLGTRPPPGRDR